MFHLCLHRFGFSVFTSWFRNTCNKTVKLKHLFKRILWIRIMACKELMMCLFLLNEIILTNCQLIQDQQDRCTNNVDKDLLLKLRELQLELSVYRELMEQSIETTRLLQDRLSKVELDYSTFRNESMESELQLKEHIRLLKEEVEEYKNESIHKDLALEDELRKRGKACIGNSNMTWLFSSFLIRKINGWIMW